LAIAKIVVVYPNIKVLIVGDGEENEKLVGLSKKLKIETNVIFLGFRSNIMELLIASDFFIMTSVSEGYPLVLIEAKIVGLPIITTDFDGVENIIEDGVNGLIAEMKNPDHIAEKAIELLNCKDLQKRLSKSNSAQIKSTEQMCAEYLDLFEQLECN